MARAQTAENRLGGPDTNSEEAKSVREEILALIERYYQLAHAPGQQAAFTPGESLVNYAGRVYDASEMKALVESALEFRLTADRFAKNFEQKLAKYLGVRFVMLVNSGSSANLIAFRALTSPLLAERRIKPGDEVITVAAGFPTTVAPAVQYGAIPVFVDVKLEDGTYNIDTGMLEQALSPRTKALMLAHTLGNPFDLRAVTEFCKKHKLWLVEDNCDALGSRYDGKLTGSFGDIATSSFYPAHHITTGEGGAVYTQNGQLKRASESFRDWGRDCWCEAGCDNTCGKRFAWELGELPQGYDHKYIYGHFGYNLKLTDMQAAIGLAQMDKLDSFVEARRRNWKMLRDSLADLEQYFILPNPTQHSEPSWFGFVLTLRENCPFKREELTSFLESRKIQTRVLFAGNLLRHPLFDEMRQEKRGYRVVGELKNSDLIMTNTFWIGVYPGLRESQVLYMANSIREFCSAKIQTGSR